MADALTNTSTVANALQAEYWQSQFLSVLEANLLFSKFGIQGQLPMGVGKSVFWKRFEKIGVSPTETVAASGGKDPDAVAVSVNVVSAILREFKQWVRVDRIWKDVSFPGTTDELVQRLAYDGALLADTTYRDSIFTAGGSAQIGGTAIARTSMKRNGSFSMDVAELREAKKRLNKANVPTMANGLYVGILNPDAEFDLQGDSSWTAIVYPTTEGINRAFQGKTGAIFGTEFYLTTQAKNITDGASAGASANVAQTYIFGDEYYGTVTPRNVELIIKDPFPGSPLNSYSSYGYNLWTVGKQLKSTRMVRIETVNSAD